MEEDSNFGIFICVGYEVYCSPSAFTSTCDVCYSAKPCTWYKSMYTISVIYVTFTKGWELVRDGVLVMAAPVLGLVPYECWSRKQYLLIRYFSGRTGETHGTARPFPPRVGFRLQNTWTSRHPLVVYHKKQWWASCLLAVFSYHLCPCSSRCVFMEG